jgi:hypothetical protein
MSIKFGVKRFGSRFSRFKRKTVRWLKRDSKNASLVHLANLLSHEFISEEISFWVRMHLLSFTRFSRFGLSVGRNAR